MIITLDMSSGSYEKASFVETFGEYEDEVLDAQWLPRPGEPLPECQTALQEVPLERDFDDFLQSVYVDQE